MTERQRPRVDTLTASVRTLMIGEDMVTASIVKQVDMIDLAYMDVIFGRVKVDLGVSGHIVAGADKDGQLRIARVALSANPDESVVRISRVCTDQEMFVCVGTAHEERIKTLIPDVLYQTNHGPYILHLLGDVVTRTCGREGAACTCREPYGPADPWKIMEVWDAISEAERIQSKRPAKAAEARRSEPLVLAEFS